MLTVGAFLRVFNLLFFHALDSDEAVYTQVVFAMTRGYIPYKNVCFVHPPVYLYIEYLFMLVNPNLWSIRLFNVLLGIATVCIIFCLCKLLYSEKVALIASVIYALYPLAIYSNKLAIVENGLTFFTTLMIYLFAKYLKKSSIKDLYLSGLFAGISFMTKYTAISSIVALVLFATLRFFKKNLKHLFLFIASTIAFPLVIFLFLLITGVWPYFFMQTIYWHLIRFGMPFHEKLWFFSQIFVSLLPLFLLALPTIHDNIGEWGCELMMSWFFVPLAVLALSKIIFLHYAFSLMPPISILAARSVDRYIPKITLSNFPHQILNLEKLWKAFVVLLTISILIVGLETLFNLSYGVRWFFVENVVGTKYHETLLQTQMTVGNYINGVTSPGDMIWTTDASIAFFAKRVIVAPNSEHWKFQGFFQDVWGYGWTPDDYRGPISGYPQGLITLRDILTAWENEKPKVIVILRTSWVDYFIWSGINNTYHTEKGLADYIKSHYQIEATFYLQNIEVWIKKDA